MRLLRKTTLAGLSLAGLLLAGLLLSPPPAAAETSAAERAKIESVIRDYLLANPEIVMEALEELDRRVEARAEADRAQALAESREQLERDPASPVLGNPDGDVVVVEFFDYQCGYCKQVAEPLRRLLEEDAGVRLVMKEFPILGPASVQGARAALAAARQGLYEEFHWALMGHRGQLSEARVLEIAEASGLDVTRLRADMRDPAIEEKLRNNYRLAESLDIRGTPAFVVGGTLLPGAVPLERLRQVVAEARAGG